MLLSFIPGLQWLAPLGKAIAGVGLALPGNLGNSPGTPPTFPDPLGNTQATLNSIYHPVDPGRYVIDNFTNGDETLLKNVFYDLYGPTLNDCIGVVFKASSKRIPKQTIQNSPYLDTSQDSHQLGEHSDWSHFPEGTPHVAAALNDPRKGPHGTVYIAKDNWEDPDGQLIEREGDYVHELGNILARRYFGDAYRFGKPNGVGHNLKDFDTGANLENCVFAGKTIHF